MSNTNRAAWCADKLSKLLVEDLRISTLSEIKDHFTAISQDEAFKYANVMQLPIVFDCLNDTKTEQIDLACEVLTLCMNNLSLGESTSRYGPSLERALHHPASNVKLMSLKEIHRTASSTESISELSQLVPLLVSIVNCIGDPELSVAKHASDILILVGKSREGLRQLLIPEIKKAFMDTILISDIVRFRVYEIIVNIASHSDENLQNILHIGLVKSFLSEMDSDDVLLKLNVVELLLILALSSHGLLYLQGEGVIDKLHTQLANINDDPLGNLVAPGLIRFFGNIAHWKPAEIFSQYPASFTVLFDIINASDFSLLGVALDTLGHIAETNDGKFTLALLEKQIPQVLRNIGSKLGVMPTDLRIRALNCIENLIRVPRNEHDLEVCNLTHSWFQMFGDEPMMNIVKYAQNPFIDIRLAGLAILQAIAELRWGQEAINNYPSLIEFLMDRRIETCKESKETKYEIIKALSGSPVFNGETAEKLTNYVSEGPFFVEALTEVAIESGQ